MTPAPEHEEAVPPDDERKLSLDFRGRARDQNPIDTDRDHHGRISARRIDRLVAALQACRRHVGN
jgi:hypothetical protein